ncbi:MULTISPECIES: hypothetical protein [unclassified Cryobacterium]|uniref:hypothetical protein n=1 Tax=unclassified Cryobacterium TaxID=2649013 RepID=UPI0014489072|nr:MULTISPECIES: hypothetical protein [unclassified Cryobacterium]
MTDQLQRTTPTSTAANGFAAAGLALGILGLTLGIFGIVTARLALVTLILAILAIVFGALGGATSKRIGGVGRGMSVWAMSLGIFPFAFALLLRIL